MRIAFAAEGTRGDVFPLLELASSFVAHGHQVVICAPPGFRQAVEQHDMEFRPVGDDLHEFLARHAEMVTDTGIRGLRLANAWMRSTLARQFQALPEATRGVDHIFGAGIQIAARSVAEMHGVPYRYVIYCPVILPSAEYPPAVIAAQDLPHWMNRLCWTLVRCFYDRWLLPRLNAERARLGLRPTRDIYAHFVTDRPLVAVDAPLAQVPGDCPFETEQIPCLHAMSGPPLPDKLESFLDQGPPPVYVGFGSMTDPDPAATTRSVLEAVAALGCRALLSRGWARLGEGPLPEGVLAVGSVSHARLFPRVAAVVHHGGAGTTTMAARAGVPQLIVPHVADQFYWGRRVAALGLGPPPLRRRRLNAGSLAAALANTLGNETLIERAREIRSRLLANLDTDPDPHRLLGKPERL